MFWASSADWNAAVPLASLCEAAYAGELGHLTRGGAGFGVPGLDSVLGALALAAFDLRLRGASPHAYPPACAGSLWAATRASQHLFVGGLGAPAPAGAWQGGQGLAPLAAAAARAYDQAFVCGVALGAAYLTAGVAEPTWLVWLCSLDPVLALLELVVVALLQLHLRSPGLLLRVNQNAAEDVATFCAKNGLSLTELAAVLTLGVGFLVFDVFVSVAEDDLTDVIGYGVLALVCLSAAALTCAADVQFFLLVSGAGSGEATLRSVIAGLVDNGLCLLRVFLCWLRYLFYDLQAELVDFAFHYADAANGAGPHSFLFGQSRGWAAPGGAEPGLGAAGAYALWALLAVVLDLSFFVVQLLFGAFKLGVALYLLWMIVDLVLMRALARTEAAMPRRARGADAGGL